MRRFFSSRQRRVLAAVAGGYCGACGKQLQKNFHADHVVPHSKGGQTVLGNGQALCAECNLKKGAKDAR